MTEDSKTIEYPTTPFSIRASKVATKPGCWDATRVEIFKDGQPIGEYERSYPSFAKRTFCPFMKRFPPNDRFCSDFFDRGEFPADIKEVE